MFYYRALSAEVLISPSLYRSSEAKRTLHLVGYPSRGLLSLNGIVNVEVDRRETMVRFFVLGSDTVHAGLYIGSVCILGRRLKVERHTTIVATQPPQPPILMPRR